MSRSWSTFRFDKNLPLTTCVMYNSDKLKFTNVSSKGYPDDAFRDDNTGQISGGMKGCDSDRYSRQCGNFGSDAGSNMCPEGTDLLLRHQLAPQIWRYLDSTAYTFIGTQNNICFKHDNRNADCYYSTFDKCGKLDSTNCDIGTATATITKYRLLDPEIDYDHQDAVKGDGVKIPQATSNTASLNGEGAVECSYQYDFSSFITNQSNVRQLTDWVNDLYDGMVYLH